MASITGNHEDEAVSISRRLDKLSSSIDEASRMRNGYLTLISALKDKEGQEPGKSKRQRRAYPATNTLIVGFLESQEEERKRLSRDLHDGLGQLLTHLKLQTQQCLADVAASGNTELLGEAWQRMEQLPELLTEALAEVRGVCRALRPSILDELGVLAAITSQCRKIMQSTAGLQIETAFSVTEPEIPDAAKTAIYRIVQEAMTNCIKYADANTIHVSLEMGQNALILHVQDNGKGFEVNGKTGNGIGLISMRERAQSLQGGFTIESAPTKGTLIQVSIPLKRQHHS